MTSLISGRRSAGRSGKAAYSPAAGDIVWTNFTPQAGSEQAGKRPALVISEIGFNGPTGFAFVAPITSAVKGWPFEVPLPVGLKTTGVVLADQMKPLDLRSRGVSFIEGAPPEVLDEVRARLAPILGL